MAEERLQKILARAGYGSRRACEGLIERGQVTVNGALAHLGSKADFQKDAIAVNGAAITRPEQLVYIALHKPRGVLSDEDPHDPRTSVRDLITLSERLYAVGRLDLESEGLILMTNDGDLAYRLTHPKFGHEKEYRVLVASRPDEKQLATWRRGVVLEDGYHTVPAKVEVDSPAGKGIWLRVIMREGRKRQIREVGRQIGLPVVKIVRLRIGTLWLGNLKPREWRYLAPEEITSLKSGPTISKTIHKAVRRNNQRNNYAAARSKGNSSKKQNSDRNPLKAKITPRGKDL